MSRRQIRITGTDPVKSRLKDFLNRDMAVVLRDNTVINATLLQAEQNNAVLLNHRLKRLTVRVDDIREFYVDIDA